MDTTNNTDGFENISLLTNMTWDLNASEAAWVSLESMELKILEKTIHRVGLPIIIFVGVIGNLLSLCVFAGTHLRYQSTSVYLIFLNLVDIVFLLCLAVMWLAWIDIHLIHNNGWCQLTIYLTYVSSFLSVWAVVSFSMERFIVVLLPLRRRTWCTRGRAMRVTIALSVFAIAFYSFSLWTTGIEMAQGGNGPICRWMPDYNHILTVLIPLDSVITFVIPSVAIVVLNITITANIWKFILSRNRKLTMCNGCGKLLHISSPAPSRSEPTPKTPAWKMLIPFFNVPTPEQRPQHPRHCCRCPPPVGCFARRQGMQQLRTTRTLILLSIVFILLHTPSHVFRLFIIIKQLHSTEIQTTRVMKLCQSITQVLYYANFALNFFLYCAFSRMFRSALTKCVQRKRKALLNLMTSSFGKCRDNAVVNS